jgi:Winged helix DNA-binding domain
MMRLGLVTGFPGLAEAAVALAGVHAQVMSSAEVAIGLRVPGVTRSDVRSSDALVRTYGPRGTVHLLAAGDLGRWTALLSSVSAVPAASGLTSEQGDLLIGAIDAALAGGEQLTMDELDAQVVAQVGEWAGELCMPAFGGLWPRWRHVLPLASMRGVLCFGAGRGRRVTYCRPAPGLAAPALTPAELVLWSVRTYLHAYGPSTPARFANWLAIDPGRAEAMFGAADLVPVDVEGTAAWDCVDWVSLDAVAAEAVAGVRLLPYFDSYSYRVGVLCPETMYPGRAAARALRGAYQTLIVDGLVAGVWQQQRSGSSKLAVTVEPVVRLRPEQRELVAEQAAVLAAIQERTLSSLTYGTVRSGAHA